VEEKTKKERSRSQDVAAAGAFFCAKAGSKKVERTFYSLGFRRKTEDFRECGPLSVEKKSLLFSPDFRILGSISGEKWGLRQVSGGFPHSIPKKGERGRLYGTAAGEIE
jgi:hypothetical protein